MKAILPILTILLTPAIWSLAEVPPFQTKTFEFQEVSPTNQVIAYRVYTVTFPVTTTSTNYLYSTTSNRFTITNMLAVPQKMFVTTSNLWGESDPCVPYLMPIKPTPVSNLQPITTELRVPLPGLVETTTDLVNYNEHWNFFLPTTNGVQVVRYRHTPNEEHKFFRTRPVPPGISAPLPSR